MFATRKAIEEILDHGYNATECITDLRMDKHTVDEAVEIIEASPKASSVSDMDIATCGTCERSWNDALSTSITPVPSGRCPFEYDHEDEGV